MFFYFFSRSPRILFAIGGQFLFFFFLSSWHNEKTWILCIACSQERADIPSIENVPRSRFLESIDIKKQITSFWLSSAKEKMHLHIYTSQRKKIAHSETEVLLCMVNCWFILYAASFDTILCKFRKKFVRFTFNIIISLCLFCGFSL